MAQGNDDSEKTDQVPGKHSPRSAVLAVGESQRRMAVFYRGSVPLSHVRVKADPRLDCCLSSYTHVTLMGRDEGQSQESISRSPGKEETEG